MKKTFCSRCGKELEKYKEPFLRPKQSYNTASGKPVYIQEYRCPKSFGAWFPQHDYEYIRL